MALMQNEAHVSLPTERLTWSEIRLRFPDQQVYVIGAKRADPTHTDFVSAIVVGVGASEEEAFAQAERYWNEGTVVERRFTGRSKKPLLRPPVYFAGSKKPLIRPPVYFYDDET